MGNLAGYEITVVSAADGVPAMVSTPGLWRTPFQSTEWLTAWFATFGRDNPECHLVVVRRTGDERPLMLLPLVRENRRGLRLLTLPDLGVSDYQSALLAPDFRLDALTARRLWKQIVDRLPPSDVLLMERVPIEAAERMAIGERTRQSPFTAYALDLDAPFAAIRERRFDPSTGRRLARNRRKLENKGSLVFDFVTGLEALSDLEQVLAWRRERFRHINRQEQEDGQLAFYRQLMVGGGPARVGRLSLSGEMIGGCLALVEDERILLVAIAYDPRFKNWAPGMLTFESCMAAACDAGLKVFDLTIGDETYKRALGVEPVHLRELRIPRTLRGCLLLAAYDLKGVVKCALHRIGLLRPPARPPVEPTAKACDEDAAQKG